MSECTELVSSNCAAVLEGLSKTVMFVWCYPKKVNNILSDSYHLKAYK
jgi:hypothetical protein